MRYHASYGLLLIVAVLLALTVGCYKPVEGPSVLVSSPEFDAGTVTTDDRLDHRFVIENRGNKPLALHSVKTSCGCAAAIIQQEEVPPGESVHVQVSFHPGGTAGKKTATAVVATSDPAHANIILRLRCDFRPEIYATPKEFQFGRFPASEIGVAVSVVDIISGNELEEFEIKAVETAGAPGFTTSVETVRAGIHYRITAVNDKPIPPGGYSSSIGVKTNHKKLPELTIPLTGIAVRPVEVQPSTVLLDCSTEDKKTRDYILRVMPGTVGDFRVTNVSAPSGVIVQTEAKAKHTVVRLIDIPSDCGINGSHIIIETTVNGMEPLQVPIVVRGC